jgi:hypothetical protein
MKQKMTHIKYLPRDLGDLEERIYLNLGQHQLLEEFQHNSGCTKVRRLVARRIPTQSGIYKGETMLVGCLKNSNTRREIYKGWTGFKYK